MAGHENKRDSLRVFQLLPNLVTILGLCAGLTSIRFMLAERYEIAAILIIFAAVIDGLDGLLARRLKATSSFGAELDSLSDFLNFGLAPGILVFQFALTGWPGFGWIFVLAYIVCCCMRLARFNVNRNATTPGGGVHFVGVPAPAGALLAMLPVFLTFEGIIDASTVPIAVAIYLGVVGALMVSTIPTPSPKSLRISKDKAGWVMVGAAIVVGVMLTRLWLLLIVANALYVITLLHVAVTHRLRARSRP